MAIRINDTMRSQIVDAGIIGGLGTSGILKVYGGTQPSVGGEATTQGIIVQIDGISWSPATNGTSLITGTKTGTAGTAGTAAWARLSGTDGTSYVVDGNCGTAATSNFVIDAVAIDSTSIVSLTAATLIQPAS
jgi:hypothetical protein